MFESSTKSATAIGRRSSVPRFTGTLPVMGLGASDDFVRNRISLGSISWWAFIRGADGSNEGKNAVAL